MDYFINPVWFYWLGVCDGLNALSIVLALFSGIVLVSFIAGYMYNHAMVIKGEYEDNKHYMAMCKAGIKWSVSVFLPLLLIAIFSPNKQTLNGLLSS